MRRTPDSHHATERVIIFTRSGNRRRRKARKPQRRATRPARLPPSSSTWPAAHGRHDAADMPRGGPRRPPAPPSPRPGNRRPAHPGGAARPRRCAPQTAGHGSRPAGPPGSRCCRGTTWPRPARRGRGGGRCRPGGGRALAALAIMPVTGHPHDEPHRMPASAAGGTFLNHGIRDRQGYWPGLYGDLSPAA
jgi:hypothetical protein